jgi:RNase P subunit RPR2
MRVHGRSRRLGGVHARRYIQREHEGGREAQMNIQMKMKGYICFSVCAVWVSRKSEKKRKKKSEKRANGVRSGFLLPLSRSSGEINFLEL